MINYEGGNRLPSLITRRLRWRTPLCIRIPIGTDRRAGFGKAEKTVGKLPALVVLPDKPYRIDLH
jgi:hypothetical protein